eukprot:TRINITY_DN1297_c0_g1_i2.p1 TRINITY_DN1297_c0_g1~~TRINITY_DN1297_c0_g1_i2.p1  ORF type:complete len:597 (+),score=54.85 TRINITY_DN1297_c0_g1_i2:406-2196(+)
MRQRRLLAGIFVFLVLFSLAFILSVPLPEFADPPSSVFAPFSWPFQTPDKPTVSEASSRSSPFSSSTNTSQSSTHHLPLSFPPYICADSDGVIHVDGTTLFEPPSRLPRGVFAATPEPLRRDTTYMNAMNETVSALLCTRECCGCGCGCPCYPFSAVCAKQTVVLPPPNPEMGAVEPLPPQDIEWALAFARLQTRVSHRDVWWLFPRTVPPLPLGRSPRERASSSTDPTDPAFVPPSYPRGLTFFAVPKPAPKGSTVWATQVNAVRSWIALAPRPEVLLFASSDAADVRAMVDLVDGLPAVWRVEPPGAAVAAGVPAHGGDTEDGIDAADVWEEHDRRKREATYADATAEDPPRVRIIADASTVSFGHEDRDAEMRREPLRCVRPPPHEVPRRASSPAPAHASDAAAPSRGRSSVPTLGGLFTRAMYEATFDVIIFTNADILTPPVYADAVLTVATFSPAFLALTPRLSFNMSAVAAGAPRGSFMSDTDGHRSHPYLLAIDVQRNRSRPMPLFQDDPATMSSGSAHVAAKSENEKPRRLRGAPWEEAIFGSCEHAPCPTDSPRAVDIFAFTRATWRGVRIPEFAIGRPVYDNWPAG